MILENHVIYQQVLGISKLNQIRFHSPWTYTVKVVISSHVNNGVSANTSNLGVHGIGK